MSGISCAGDVYFNRIGADGQPSGMIFLFDAKRFAINEPSEDVDRILRGRETFGQLGDSYKVKQPATVSIRGDEMSAQVLALALLGTAAAATQTEGTVSEAALTLKHDVWAQLPHAYIETAGFVLTDDGAVQTFVEGTDYMVNRRLGWVMALSTGAIEESEVLEVSYGYADATGSIVSGGNSPDIRGRLVMDGKNLATGRDIIVDCDEAILAPSEELDLAAEGYVAVQLEGKLRTVPPKTSPYTVEYR